MLDKNLENKECRELCGLFYSVFDNSLGRINVAQYPDFFSKELFGQVSNFVITKDELANRVIVSKVDGKFVIGCLQSLDDSKYPRNKFLFNVCFVVNEEVSDNLISYENLVRNVNRFCCSLEQETGHLHDADKTVVGKFLENIYCGLKETGMCKYTWGGFGTIYLRMGCETEPNVVVECEQVPVLNNDRRIIPLDLTTQRLLPLLNGESRIWDIAQKSQVDFKVVRACVQNLGYIGAIKTVAPFRLSSIYMCMPKLIRSWRDTELRRKLVEYVLNEEINSLENEKFENIAESALRALAILGPQTKVSDCNAMLSSTNQKFNCRQLIQFAEMEGLIRKVNGHPINITDIVTDKHTIPNQVLDGTHNLEEIACMLDTPFPQLESEINKSDAYVIWN